jgi:hypothetical protein
MDGWPVCLRTMEMGTWEPVFWIIGSGFGILALLLVSEALKKNKKK